MSISKSWVSNQQNIQQAMTLYRSRECPYLEDIAKKLNTSYQNVQWVCKNFIPPEEYKALTAIRWSHSKQGEKNPMYGKTGQQHHNWIGLVDDGYGYLTCLHNGKRQFVHRIVIAEALGLQEIPAHLSVHHIDGNPKNNDLDNLALVTKSGHKQIHFRESKDSLSIALKKSRIVDALKYMT
jgi:hypothetical protein